MVKDSNATYTPGLYERRAGSTRQLHHNLKNVEAQTTLTPAISASRTYDAFGNVLSSTGTHLGPFGYGGGFSYQEDSTGLQLLGHRLYDSSTGRFLTRDPIKDGRNWYVYCDSDPIGFADPDGREVVTIVLVGGLLIAGAAFVRLLSDLGVIFNEAIDKHDRPIYGDDELLTERLDQNKGWIDRTMDIAVDEAKGNYGWGPIGEVGARVGKGIHEAWEHAGPIISEGGKVSSDVVGGFLPAK